MLRIFAVACTALCVVTMSAEAAPAGLFRNHGGYTAMQQSDEIARQLFTNIFSTVLSAVNRKMENGEIQSNDDLAKAFFGVMNSILSAAGNQLDPNDQFGRTVLNGFQTLFSTIGNNFGETQSNEIPKAVLGLIGDLSSAARKKADPNDKTAQLFFNLFNGLLSTAKNSLGNGLQEEANAELYLPRIPFNGFGRNEEAEEQFWGSVIRGALGGAARDIGRRVIG